MAILGRETVSHGKKFAFLSHSNNACHYLHPPVPSARSSCRTIDKAPVFPSQMDQVILVRQNTHSDSRARLVAWSFQGYMRHVDGKLSDACFNHSKRVTMDDNGNVYVADPMNLAIRKISDAGVTTIAGGKSNVAGYGDGPSEDAKFSNDFDVVYIRPTCSLLVIDRGNAALRQISLSEEDCDYEYSSISSTS